jgi:hypothetical protein
MHYEEEITLAELADRFLGIQDFSTPEIYDMSDYGVEVETMNKDGVLVFVPILNFIVKDSVTSHYTDGKLKGTANHRIIESGVEVHLKDHPEFYKTEHDMQVVDVEVGGEHTYLANGRLNHNTTAGGMAIGFHASVRVRLEAAAKLKNKDEEVIGVNVKAKIIKNRFGPPHRQVEFDVYFDRGIDDTTSIFKYLKKKEVIKASGAWATYVDQHGEEHKFQSSSFTALLENPELKEELYAKMCDVMIMSYKTQGLTSESDDVQSEQGPTEE